MTALAGETIGWKTSIQHWNDDAVWMETGGSWAELKYWTKDPLDPLYHPYAGQSMDLAFVITTTDPIPAGVLLLGSGLLGLLGFEVCRRRG